MIIGVAVVLLIAGVFYKKDNLGLYEVGLSPHSEYYFCDDGDGGNLPGIAGAVFTGRVNVFDQGLFFSYTLPSLPNTYTLFQWAISEGATFTFNPDNYPDEECRSASGQFSPSNRVKVYVDLEFCPDRAYAGNEFIPFEPGVIPPTTIGSGSLKEWYCQNNKKFTEYHKGRTFERRQVTIIPPPNVPGSTLSSMGISSNPSGGFITYADRMIQ